MRFGLGSIEQARIPAIWIHAALLSRLPRKLLWKLWAWSASRLAGVVAQEPHALVRQALTSDLSPVSEKSHGSLQGVKWLR